MDIEYKGANTIVISTKNLTVVSDPKLSLVGLKDVKLKGALQINTAHNFIVEDDDQRLIIDGPGEYEISDVSVRGVPALRHVDTPESPQKATMYHVDIANVRVGIIGHVAAALTDEQLEQLGTIDILIIPVGGNGYTLDSHDAAALTRRIGPKAVIPTHYNDDKITYEVPQNGIDSFVKEVSAPHEVMPKLKIKNGALPEVLTVIELSRTA